MRILIDTHVLIGYLNGDADLSPHLLKILENPDNKIIISTVSLWELTIKISLKKLEIDKSLSEIEQYINDKDVELLDIKFNSLTALSSLPYHHKDPFDRLLIAQAIAENLSIVSADRYFHAYPINVIW